MAKSGTREPARFGAGEKRLVMEGVATPADKAASPYMYLPFVVPEGTESITVRYSYEETGILDIGLVDPEIEPFPARKGFRGWSGSARREFFVARDVATPGYVPGAPQPGVWQVILGLHQVPAQGCRYRVEVVLDEPVDRPGGVLGETGAGATATAPADGAQATAKDAADGTAAAEGEADALVTNEAGPGVEALAAFRQASGKVWRRGELHSHTFHSDAKGSPEELTALARSRGLEFLAITEHNTASHHPFLAALQRPGFLVIPGEEITTDLGHANVWGVEGWVDFRLHSDEDVELLVQEVLDRGGLISVNHPKQGGPPWTYAIPRGVCCIEAWQMLWPINNQESLALYDRLLRQGRRFTLVGGSDWHQPAATGGGVVADRPVGDVWTDAFQVGNPTTWVDAPELTVADVLDAVRRGAVFVSEGPAGPMVDVRMSLRVSLSRAEAEDGTQPDGTADDTASDTAADTVGMGQQLVVGPGDAPVVEGLIVGARGDVARWVGSNGVLREVLIDADLFRDRWPLAEPTTYVRLEVVRRFAETGPAASLERVRALSNPVYIVREG